MSDKNNMRPDLGWIVAFTLVGLFFIFVVMQFPTVRSLACKPAEEDCFRQWMSALGGWAAVAAAVPTIYYLYRQTRAAADYQRVNFVLAVQSNVALAAAARTMAAEIKVILKRQYDAMGPDIEDRELAFKDGIDRLNRTCRILERPLLSEFESRIGNDFGYASHSVHALAVKHVELICGAAEGGVADISADHWQSIGRIYAGAVDFIDQYADELVKAANAYIGHVKELQDSIS